ncbi:MAG: TIM barrel protein, partial [Woeseiaceae bacterium]|nr:TIM barrel protein [Woeseiaceae bacterium]
MIERAFSETGRNSMEVLARLAEKAKASGITLGLEAVNRYESNLINTGAQAMEFIKESGADNIKVHLDSYHMNIEEGDLAAAIKSCGDMLGYFHVGDYAAVEWTTHFPVFAEGLEVGSIAALAILRDIDRIGAD